jgi:hypothetical protein
MLGQRQPLPGGRTLPTVPPAPGQRCHLLGGGLLVSAGVLAGLFGLGGAPGGQPQLPGAIRRTGRAELGEPVAFGPQLPGGQPTHVQEVGGVAGQSLAAVTSQDPGQQLLRRP